MGFVILVAMETNKLQSSEPCDWDKKRIQAQWHAFDFMATVGTISRTLVFVYRAFSTGLVS